MKTLKLSIIALSLVGFAACSASISTNTSTSVTNTSPTPFTPVVTPATDELASAKKIYSEKCVRCHKEDGTGGQVDIEGTKLKVPDFTTEKMKNDDDADFIDAIENGIVDDGMPAFKGKIPDAEIKNLVKLIRRDFQKKS